MYAGHGGVIEDIKYSTGEIMTKLDSDENIILRQGQYTKERE